MESTLDLSKIELHAGLYAEHSGFHELREKLESEGFTVFVWQDSPGTSYQNLTKPTDELIVVSQGRIVITVSEMEYGLSAGDALTMPANTMHNAQNVDHMACCYFICTRGGEGAPIMKRPE